MCEIKPDLIYHYCSSSSFLNIIFNKSFRLGDIEKSNDSLEKKLVINTIIDLLKNELQIQTDPNINNAIAETRRMLGEVNDIHSYACCFSEEADSLSQWRGYADEASGMAIGIDRSMLDFEFQRYKFFKVSYDQQEMRSECERVIREAIEQTMTIFPLRNPTNLFINMQELLREIYLKYKNDVFKNENEWRIVVNSGIMTQIYDDRLFVMGLDNPEGYVKSGVGSFKFSKLQHCVIEKQLRSYIDLSFEQEKDNIIKEIWLGPKCKSKQEDIHVLMRASGYNVERMYNNGFRVRASRASYR